MSQLAELRIRIWRPKMLNFASMRADSACKTADIIGDNVTYRRYVSGVVGCNRVLYCKLYGGAGNEPMFKLKIGQYLRVMTKIRWCRPIFMRSSTLAALRILPSVHLSVWHVRVPNSKTKGVENHNWSKRFPAYQLAQNVMVRLK